MNKKLRLRFIDDLSYPVSVVEDPYFDYQLSLCPGGIEDWKRLKEGIEKEYEGNPELFLQAYYEVREKMIQDLQGSEKFKEAVVPEVDRKEVARSKDIYNEEYAGRKKVYVSIDLKKANVQAFLILILNSSDGMERTLKKYGKRMYSGKILSLSIPEKKRKY